MVVPLLLAVFALSTGQFGQPGGIPNPALVHQRFRGNETLFAGQDFFQWWFFWLRGADGQHFTMHYSLSRVPTENGGGFLGFSFVSEGTNEKGFRADRFLEGMQVAGYCNVSLGGHSNFLAVDDNTYLLTGSMRGKDQQFHATPNLQGVDVSWNVTVRRVHGWYGENGLVGTLADTFGKGMISWSPYGHLSLASGLVTVGNETFEIVSQASAPNAYADMNWGRKFPLWSPRTKLDRRDYAWGWYSMQTGEGASIIVGLGLTETGFPSFSVFGGFADLYFGPGKGSVSVRYVAAEYGGPLQFDILSDASDGSSAKRFEVRRSQWANYTDAMGTVEVPLQQDLHLVTATLDFTASCVVDLRRTNRLLFPYQYVFSDFETLGACCQFRAVLNGAVVLSGNDCHAGVEYGRN